MWRRRNLLNVTGAAMTISEAFDTYLQDVIVFKSQSDKTEENHIVCMRSMLHFFGDIDVESLTLPMIRRWKASLDKRVSRSTVRNYIIRFRVVLTHTYQLGYKVVNPDLVPVPKRTSHVPQFITPEETQLLIDTALAPRAGYRRENRLRNAAIISLLAASGVRNSELCGLDRVDMRPEMTFTVMGKGEKPRLCFFDERTTALLKEYMQVRVDEDAALFVSPQTGRRISNGTIQEIFRVVSRHSGLNKRVHPHMMRHSFATDLLKNNTNLRYVQEFLGHESILTTQMYTHVVNEDLHSVYREKHRV